MRCFGFDKHPQFNQTNKYMSHIREGRIILSVKGELRRLSYSG